MTDIFNKEESKDDDKSVEDKSIDNNQPDTADTYLGLMLNEEGKPKYATAEEALKGAVHAQSHITNLEKELKELRSHEDKDVGMEKILEALKGGDDKSKDEDVKSDSITPETIADVVTQLLDKRDTVTTQKQNITTVVDKFKTLYGEKASETMYGKAKDLGFGQEEINSLIATNPIAAMKILGVDEVKAPVKDIVTADGGINTDGFQNKGDEEIKSSMGYINEKELTENWETSKAATLKRLGITIDNP